jgi:hypothetical protein
MTDPVIELDKSKTYSTCHGERTEDDPHHLVAFWQGGQITLDGKKKIVTLPFDVHGNLVPDDGRTEKFEGRGIDKNGNSIMVKYDPLYNADMRRYLNAKLDRSKQLASKQPEPDHIEDEDTGSALFSELDSGADDDVNFAAWLRGQANYPAYALRDAAQKRFSKKYHKIVPDLVVDLVLDEKVVPEDQLSTQFKRVIDQAAAGR